MAKLIATGAAQARSQITTVTLAGTWAAADTATIKIGGKSVTYVCGGSETPTTVAAALLALCVAQTSVEFRDAKWSSLAAVITATSTAGVSMTITASKVSASGTIVAADTQTATGPNHWDNVDNWSTGAVPTTADEVYIDQDSIAFLYGLPTSLTLGKFVQSRGQVGLTDINGSGGYEYRTKRAVFTCLDVTIGFASGDGPSLCRLDLASGAAVVTVLGSKSISNGYAVDLKFNSATATVAVLSGQTAINPNGAETTTVGTVRVANEGSCYIGIGTTITTVVSTGTTVLAASATSLTIDDGVTTIKGIAAITTLLLRGGTLVHKSSGIITTATVSTAILDCNQDIRPRTITTLTLNKGGILRDRYTTMTITNKIAMGTDADQMQAV